MNSVFYSSNMLQSSERSIFPVFGGKNMQKDEYSGYLSKIKSKINDKTVPEFGNFERITANVTLNNNDCLVFQVKPLKQNPEQKNLEINFANAKTGKIVTKPRVFKNKTEFLKYIDSIDEKGLKNIVDALKSDTGNY